MADYCERADQMKATPNVRHCLELVAGGNADAFNFLWSLWNFMQMLDDAIDNDKPVSVEEAAASTIKFVGELSFNPFYQKCKHMIYPLLGQVAERWASAETMALSSKDNERDMARFVRCGDVDFMLAVAFIIGGWDHMRSVQAVRGYDED